MEPLEGKPLPKVSLASSEGTQVRLPDDLMGKWVVLYSYPKDDTPGCTKEACAFRDSKAEFDRLGVRIFGLSADDRETHAQFIAKYGLNFPLLADPQRKLIDPLGSYRELEWGGNKFMGVARDTFMVDPQGVIRVVWRSVHPVDTIRQAFEAVQALIASA